MSASEIKSKTRELKELKVMKDELKAAMKERKVLCGEYKLTYQTVSSARFDSARFKREHANLAVYTRATAYRRFCVR